MFTSASSFLFFLSSGNHGNPRIRGEISCLHVHSTKAISYELVWDRCGNTTGKEDCNVEVDRTMEHQHMIFQDNCHAWAAWKHYTAKNGHISQQVQGNQTISVRRQVHHSRRFVGNHVHKCFKVCIILFFKQTFWHCDNVYCLYFVVGVFLRWVEMGFLVYRIKNSHINTSKTIRQIWITEIRIYITRVWHRWSASSTIKALSFELSVEQVCEH